MSISTFPVPSSSSDPAPAPSPKRLVEHGVDPARLVLVEFNPVFCRLLRSRYPQATVVQGDAYNLKRVLENVLHEPAAAVVSGLPLLTKPVRTRVRLINDVVPSVAPGCVLHPVHLFDDHAADPEGPRARYDRSLRSHLAEFPAGPRLGLSQGVSVAR